MSAQLVTSSYRYVGVIDEICALRWETLTNAEVAHVALAYYYFSIQFRESLVLACEQHPTDSKLKMLWREECDTDNLSPWPGIAVAREKMNHDEFMRRALLLGKPRSEHVEYQGHEYLAATRNLDPICRAKSIASYEDEGLCRVFQAMLRAPYWEGTTQRAFQFFLRKHIEFDTDAHDGHGALSKHLQSDDSVLPLWSAFSNLLVYSVPRLRHG
jgi:hypothetical protein